MSDEMSDVTYGDNEAYEASAREVRALVAKHRGGYVMPRNHGSTPPHPLPSEP